MIFRLGAMAWRVSFNIIHAVIKSGPAGLWIFKLFSKYRI